MSDEIVAELNRHGSLQLLYLLIAKLDHPPRLQVDQVIVMVAGHLLVARAAVAEIVACQNACLFEQPDRAIDGGNADVRVDRGCSAVDLLDIGVIGRTRTGRGRSPGAVPSS